MYTETDSEETSADTSWTVPRRSVYYVQSPSTLEVEKMSCGSSPTTSPPHHYYPQCSPFHHSAESRFSGFVKTPTPLSTWKHVRIGQDDEEDSDDTDDDSDETDGRDGRCIDSNNIRLYIYCLVLLFLVLFLVLSLILWGVSLRYEPKIYVKDIVLENLYYQAGKDESGVPTDMLSLNSTVKISYRNPATFYAVHVTSTPWELHHFQLKLASGKMKKFTQSRKSERNVETIVVGHQVPLYGGIPVLVKSREHLDRIAMPLNLTFFMETRGYILGPIVKAKFHGRFKCSFILRGNKIGKPLNLTDSCINYH